MGSSPAIPMAVRCRKIGKTRISVDGVTCTYRICNKIYSLVAQLVERLAVNQKVVGSSPIGGAKNYLCGVLTRHLT